MVLDCIDASGGQLVGWNGKLSEKISQLLTKFSIFVKLKERATQLTLCNISVYEPNDRTLRLLFLQDLHANHAWYSPTP